jgi:signal transduction histidine kinase/PAS domain-containing protein
LVDLAALAIDVPIAIASLALDDRNRMVLASFGLDGWHAGQTAEAQFSLCGIVVDSGLPVIVNDAATDRRTWTGTGVRDSEVGAYAGFPLRGLNAQAVGCFCVVDRQPRRWTARDLAVADQTAQLLNAGIAGAPTGPASAGTARPTDTSLAFLAALLDSLDTGVAACDADGRLVLLNRSLRRLAVTTPDDSTPDQWEQQFHMRHTDGRPFEVHEMPLVRALAGEQARGVEILIGPSNFRRQALVNGHPIAGPDGERLGAVCAVHDITERRRMERLRGCELQVSQLLAQARDMHVAGRAVLAAIAGEFGWSHGELWLANDNPGATATTAPAGTLTCAVHWTTPERTVDVRIPTALCVGAGLAGTAQATGEPVWLPDTTTNRGPLTLDTVDANQICAALAVPVRSGERIIGVLTFFADERREPDEPTLSLLAGIAAHLGQYLERRRAEELELELARSKDEYLALVGHELRTPLTSISAYTELINGHPDLAGHAELRELLEVVDRNTGLLRGIIEDLLDLAAVDAGHVSLELQPVDFAALISDAVEAIRPAAGSQDLAIVVDLPDRLPVHGDPGRLRQVLNNVLGNAVKYSPDGGTVTVVATGDSGIARLTVTDSGIGIPSAEQEQVFRRFHRSSRARQHGIPGTGLGLPLSLTIIERHGGALHLTTADTGGVEVTVDLPLSDPQL